MEPLDYSEGDPSDLGRDNTVDDICDFVVDYISSDVLVSDLHVEPTVKDKSFYFGVFFRIGFWSCQVRLTFAHPVQEIYCAWVMTRSIGRGMAKISKYFGPPDAPNPTPPPQLLKGQQRLSGTCPILPRLCPRTLIRV
jgi:hypothetical protein